VRLASRHVTREADRSFPGMLAADRDYRELKHGLGLDCFEGLWYVGWRRNVTLAAPPSSPCSGPT
jgi:hypothetical protein